MRKLVALCGACLFFFLIFSMYLVLDQFGDDSSEDELFKKTQHASRMLGIMEKQVEKLEEKMAMSKSVINDVSERLDVKIDKRTYDEMRMEREDGNIHHPKALRVMNKHPVSQSKDMCHFSEAPSGQSATIKMLDVFDEIPFENPDGGAWKQGWDVQYSKDAFDKDKLLIFVVPHSHNDPGWIKTVTQYYQDQTKHILDNVVDALAENRRRKFIWAEISYFSMWWNEADEGRKRLAKKQIEYGQLEIVTGGWVMTDEANPHYYAMIDQLIEGHQWLEKHIGVKPKSGWAIDPFGHSPTMAYILKRSGFDGMLIQRTHYAIKRYLARQRNLEFMWRQNWDKGTSTDMFCHMMPFYSYDIPHTCGPDPKVCCQFDFRRLPGGGHFCPWMIAPVEIGDHNVAERATTLLDQYRKKSQLYKNNIVLAPLGDDFRYEVKFEADNQYRNYQLIMDYINSHPELKAKIQFGTLSDYFNAVWKRTGVKPGRKSKNQASLGGDFFTYADRDDHYWSGYYTSRSFYKNMDRVLESHHRAAEILFTLAKAHAKGSNALKFPASEFFPKLTQARRDLGLFQHHDGITGTAKDHVVIDYGDRMLNAIKSCQMIIEKSAQLLLTSAGNAFRDEDAFRFIESRDSQASLPTKKLIIISNQPSPILVFNSLSKARVQVVTLHVSEPLVEVEDEKGNIVDSQTSIIWNREQSPDSKKYELAFVAMTGPLGISTYSIKRSKRGSPASVEYINENPPEGTNPAFSVKKGKSEDIVVRNSYLQATFDPAIGLLRDATLVADKEQIKMEMTFMTYGTRNEMDKSGAYLFLPDGPANEISVSQTAMVVTRGKVFTEVLSQLRYTTVSSRIYHVDVDEAKAIDIRNLVDIRDSFNTELIMRIETGLKNVDREFFTDLNGFQIQRRKTLDKLPMQANFYPMPSTAFLQATNRRFTILSAQSNGVASLKEGQIEVVLDRRLFQDDNRGLGQGVTDNKVTPSNFLLVLEKFAKPRPQAVKPIPTAYPSQDVVALTQRLQHPQFLMTTVASNLDKSTYRTSFAGLHLSWPCDQFMLNLRTIEEGNDRETGSKAALLVHRIGYDCNFVHICESDKQKVTFAESFAPLNIKSLEETSLTLMHTRSTVNPRELIKVEPMEIKTYKISFM